MLMVMIGVVELVWVKDGDGWGGGGVEVDYFGEYVDYFLGLEFFVFWWGLGGWVGKGREVVFVVGFWRGDYVFVVGVVFYDLGCEF